VPVASRRAVELLLPRGGVSSCVQFADTTGSWLEALLRKSRNPSDLDPMGQLGANRTKSRTKCCNHHPEKFNDFSGGEGIRTPGTLASTAVFKTAALDRSATPPSTGSDAKTCSMVSLPSSVESRGRPPCPTGGPPCPLGPAPGELGFTALLRTWRPEKTGLLAVGVTLSFAPASMLRPGHGDPFGGQRPRVRRVRGDADPRRPFMAGHRF
jgi:hypothetical protein